MSTTESQAMFDAYGQSLRATIQQQAADDLFAPLLARAEGVYENVVGALRDRVDSPIEHVELALLHAAMNAAPLPELVDEHGAIVLSDGTILGVGKFEQLDPGWLQMFAEMASHAFDQAPCSTEGQCIPISNQAKIGVVGDWGTGYWKDCSPPELVRDHLMNSEHPDITVHLGDEYYAGSKSEEDTFASLWPQPPTGLAFALNSNHAMYSKGINFFDETLSKKKFHSQGGQSFFALHNDHWLIFGLDSACHADELDLYMSGKIGATQQDFLKTTSAGFPNHRIIVMTHHTGLDLAGSPTTLWDEVAAPTALGRPPDYWYWGHVHLGIVYNERAGCRARCVGHGAIPNGQASAVAKNVAPAGNQAIAWYESKLADPGGIRVVNGYATVDLDDSGITETFYDESGAHFRPTP